MREERVTKEIIKYLKRNNWFIYSYDFPQSGTGTLILPDESTNQKNKNSIIPDIIAIKDNICVFFENKDRIVESDFDKVNSLRIENHYKKNISKLLSKYNVEKYYFGIGLPKNINISKIEGLLHKTDFLLLVDDEFEVSIFFDNSKIF